MNVKCITPWSSIICYLLLSLAQNTAGNTSAGDQQLQCYACGLPKVSPENDVLGSYGSGLGKKMYNHSCSEMYEQMGENKDKVPHAFVRTCPIGVKSCFGAWGFYDHRDDDPTNDLEIRFLGCSEAKYEHDYGCDKDLQNVNIRDKTGIKVQVEIEVNLCFCSTTFCNNPESELLSSNSSARNRKSSLLSGFGAVLSAILIGVVGKSRIAVV